MSHDNNDEKVDAAGRDGAREGPQPAPDAKTRDQLFAFFEDAGIACKTVEHEALFTVEEGRELKKQWPGGHSKNLFLKDKKGVLYLAVALGETRVDLVGLGKRLGAKGRLSFGKPELMTATMGVIPGAVTPFALINESARALGAVILDKALLAHERVWFHPLENTASTAVTPGDLVRFVELCGFQPQILDLEAPFEG